MTSGAKYRRASTDWFAAKRYGLCVHWTAYSMPRTGERVGFQDAVRAFDIDAFVDGVLKSGAEYLIFTVTHALQMFPCPNPRVDQILAGRTCKRDLLGEIGERLDEAGIPMIMYYNHSCNRAEDPAWEHAVGYHGESKEAFAANILDIVAWMGERYGRSLPAWWFDSSYSLDPRGPENRVSCELNGFQFPWEDMAAAAKTGNPNRLVTFNAGVDQTFLYTDHQDYWAGETNDLNHPPTGRYLENGLQWHGLTCLDEQTWVHTQANSPVPAPLYSDEELLSFVRTCMSSSAPMTFNVGIYQDGHLAEESVECLARLGNQLTTHTVH